MTAIWTFIVLWTYFILAGVTSGYLQVTLYKEGAPVRTFRIFGAIWPITWSLLLTAEFFIYIFDYFKWWEGFGKLLHAPHRKKIETEVSRVLQLEYEEAKDLAEDLDFEKWRELAQDLDCEKRQKVFTPEGGDGNVGT